MVYKVIGIMSGSSLDGLDLVHVQLDEVRGQWSFQILHSQCLSYSEKWLTQLRHATSLSVGDFLKLHTQYGRFLGEAVNQFIEDNNLGHNVHFIATHGHTVFHEPQNHTTWQLGDGATLAAVTSLPVISDLRSMDVALGGQGAPIVPIGDALLFGNYDYLLNIGGIANITIQHPASGASQLAFDVCPANQILNTLAEREGLMMDEGGALAESGSLLADVLDELNAAIWYKKLPPKSLSNEAARDLVFPHLLMSSHNNADMLHTAAWHIAHQIAEAVKLFPHNKPEATLLATGGGAFNTFLMTLVEKMLAPYNVKVVIPDADVVKYKEALVMALIGTLRWREEENVYSSVTGASNNSIGGALWIG